MQPCCHKDDKEKAITVTTTVAEVNYALSQKGYKLYQLCELYAYKKSAPLFQDFVESVEALKKELTDPILCKFFKHGLNSSYGSFIQKH